MLRLYVCFLGLLSSAMAVLPLTIDIVTPVAPKDATVYRYTLRHALRHVKVVVLN